MTKEDVTMIGFEIVAYAGDARTKLLNALQKAQNGEFEESEKLIQEAEECLLQAHKAQTEMIQKEAGGEDVELGSWTRSFNDNYIIKRINETFNRIV